MEEPRYIGPKIIGFENDKPEQRTWMGIEVIEKATGKHIRIKDYRFNPEVHQYLEDAKEKPEEKPKEEPKKFKYDQLPMKELHSLAKERGIKAPFGCKKVDLIKLLNESQ